MTNGRAEPGERGGGAGADRSPVPAPALLALSDRLLSSPMTTEALQEWCNEHHPPATQITVEKRLDTSPPPVGEEAVDALWCRPPEGLESRSIRLLRRGVPVCEVDSWFIPDRLPSDACAALRMSNVPFSTAVRELSPTRRTYLARFRSLPNRAAQGGWASGGWEEMIAPFTVILEHEALISDGDDFPLCVTHERYLATLLPEEPRDWTLDQ